MKVTFVDPLDVEKTLIAAHPRLYQIHYIKRQCNTMWMTTF